jgi:SagB-type dehydrogenase family enzyme
VGHARVILMVRLRSETSPTVSEELRFGSRLGIPARETGSKARWPTSWTEVHFKQLEQLPETRVGRAKTSPVSELLHRQESGRVFGHRALSRGELATLLDGIALRRTDPAAADKDSRRTYPSAGARYPIDTYLLIQRCRGVAPGMYFHDVRRGTLRRIGPRATRAELEEAFGERWVCEASLVCFFVAQWERSGIKYGDRGLGYAYLEAGHMAQNVMLLARSLGLNSCPVGGFWEEWVERVFHLVTPEEAPIYSLVVGPREG